MTAQRVIETGIDLEIGTFLIRRFFKKVSHEQALLSAAIL